MKTITAYWNDNEAFRVRAADMDDEEAMRRYGLSGSRYRVTMQDEDDAEPRAVKEQG